MYLLYFGIFSSFLEKHLSISFKERPGVSLSFLRHRRFLFRWGRNGRFEFSPFYYRRISNSRMAETTFSVSFPPHCCKGIHALPPCWAVVSSGCSLFNDMNFLRVAAWCWPASSMGLQGFWKEIWWYRYQHERLAFMDEMQHPVKSLH